MLSETSLTARTCGSGTHPEGRLLGVISLDQVICLHQRHAAMVANAQFAKIEARETPRLQAIFRRFPQCELVSP